MSYKPDYGLRLMRDGTSPDVDLFFYDFHLFSLSVLGRGRYSTMVEVPHDGQPHALSLDFNHRQLEQILSRATPETAKSIQIELARDPVLPRSINLEEEVAFGVRARLGDLQKVQSESFVPLAAQEIL